MDVTISCVCPPKGDDIRHPDGDTVTMRDVLDYDRAMVITKAITLIDEDDDEVRGAMVLAKMSKFYVLMGVESWTLRDVSNKPIPVSSETLRQYLLSNPEVSAVMTEAGDDLYQKAILLPLLRKASTSSAPSQTTGSTSPKRSGSRRQNPTPLRRSSTSTTPTGDTAATSSSLDGDSSFSQSGTTAA